MSNIQYFAGIDNACQGAIAIIDRNMKIVAVLKYPRYDLKQMFDLLNIYKNHCRAVVERPFLGGKKSKGNEITYEVFGTHKMNLEALGIKYDLAEPRQNMKNCWRKEFNFISKERDEIKQESISMCRLLFDNADKYILTQKKNVKSRVEYCKPDDNICEALLLAEYCRRLHLNGE